MTSQLACSQSGLSMKYMIHTVSNHMTSSDLWCFSFSQKHNSPRPAIHCRPRGTKRHRLLSNYQLPSVGHDSEETDQWDGAIFPQRHLPIGQRHGQRLWMVPGQRDQRPRIPGQSFQHQCQRLVQTGSDQYRPVQTSSNQFRPVQTSSD